MKAQKASPLIKSKKIAIAKFKQENPAMTQEEIAKHFGCKVNQVRNAIRQSETGELEKKRSRQPVAKINALMGNGVEKNLEHEFEYSVAALRAATYLTPDERIACLHKLIAIDGMLDKKQLAAHLKGADAEFVKFLFKCFIRPDLTDGEIVTLFNEYYERWKNTAG